MRNLYKSQQASHLAITFWLVDYQLAAYAELIVQYKDKRVNFYLCLKKSEQHLGIKKASNT